MYVKIAYNNYNINILQFIMEAYANMLYNLNKSKKAVMDDLRDGKLQLRDLILYLDTLRRVLAQVSHLLETNNFNTPMHALMQDLQHSCCEIITFAEYVVKHFDDFVATHL